MKTDETNRAVLCCVVLTDRDDSLVPSSLPTHVTIYTLHYKPPDKKSSNCRFMERLISG
jgi:hypothetical protein